MHLKRAIGTTFTLDLATALMVPLAFAGSSFMPNTDPILAMDGIKKTAQSVDIFCQAGAIAGGRWPSDLVAVLEPVIHEVLRPRAGRLFHPKVWVAHYGDEHGTDRFRLLVLSRNLTPDRGWDFIVRLDGEPSKTINHENRGLIRLIASLPNMAKQPLARDRIDSMRALAQRLQHVVWELPQGTTGVRFWPLGLPQTMKPDLAEMFRGYKHLVISPFITADGLDTVVRSLYKGASVTIVSRPEELNKLPTGALDGYAVHTINPSAGLDDSDGVADEVADGAKTVLSTLHAKIVVVERNHGVRAFFGSANATAAAFTGNVEFMCEFRGGLTALGVDAFLAEDGGLGRLLEPYSQPSAPVIDEVEEAWHRLEALLVEVAQVRYLMTVHEANGQWRATISSQTNMPDLPAGVTMAIGPFNHPSEETPVSPGKPLLVELVARDGADLTPFLLFKVRTTIGKQALQRSAVVVADLIGGPADRLDDILVRQLDTPEKFLQFLLLLLGLGELTLPQDGDPAKDFGGQWRQAGRLGLFELLVRALAIDATAIDRLDEIVQRLSKTSAGSTVLPKGWTDLWTTVVQARGLLPSKQ